MTRRAVLIVLCVLFATGAMRVASRSSARPSRHLVGHAIQIPPSVSRLALEPLRSPSLSREDLSLSAIRGFVVLDGMVYLLDGQGGHVVVLKRTAGHAWEEHARIGKRGTDPHDFNTPTGITTLPGDSGFAVIDGVRLLYFDKAGRPGRIRTLGLRCPAYRPAVALGPADAVFVADDCREGGVVKAVLSWSPDGEQRFIILAIEPKFAIDGSSGSVYAAPRSVTDAGDHILFGAGLTPCVAVAEKRATLPPLPLHRDCIDSSDALSAPPAADIMSRVGAVRASGRKLGPAWDWPDPMPYYADRMSLPGGQGIVRTFSAESMFVEAVAPASRTILLVAPGAGFKGCDRDACFWLSNVRGQLWAGLFAARSTSPRQSVATSAPSWQAIGSAHP